MKLARKVDLDDARAQVFGTYLDNIFYRIRSNRKRARAWGVPSSPTSNADFIGFYVAVQENPLPEGWPERRGSVCHIFKTPEADCASNTDKGSTLVQFLSAIGRSKCTKVVSAITTFYSSNFMPALFPIAGKLLILDGNPVVPYLTRGTSSG